MVLTSSGKMYSFGRNNIGQCGLGTSTNMRMAKLVEKVCL